MIGIIVCIQMPKIAKNMIVLFTNKASKRYRSIGFGGRSFMDFGKL